MMLIHQHYLAVAESNRLFSDLSEIEDWVSRLVGALGMNMLLGPFSVYCTLPGNEGITAGALLSTSHIMLHIFEDVISELQLDVYSCSSIDLNVIKDFLEELEAENISWKLLDRDKELKEL